MRNRSGEVRIAGLFSTIAKCIAVVSGGILLSVALGLCFAFVSLLLLCQGTDSGGCVVGGMGIASPGILACLTIGPCFAFEFVDAHILNGRKVRWLRAMGRCACLFAAWIGPVWILVVWPPEPFRHGYQTHAFAYLIYAITVCLTIFAFRIRFPSKSALVNAGHPV
jgi:hypothetical protein